MPEMPHHTPTFAAILRLTRWQDHVLFTLPATLLGVNLALDHVEATVDWRAGVACMANVLAVAFAFMVNDIEDAPDDARDPARAAHNVIVAGDLSVRVGWWASWSVAMVALAAFAVINMQVLAVGALTLVLGWLYSWRAVRFKAFPLVDVLAHVLMLSALLLLGGYMAYASDWARTGWVVIGVSLISAYGQLYNQLRDYEPDRVAGLRNTASVLGRRGTQWAMHGSLIGAGLSLTVAVVTGVIPLWFVLVMAGLSPLLIVFYSADDMRGTAALDASGRLQTGAMVIATLALLIWTVVISVTNG